MASGFVHPAFAQVAATFGRMFREPRQGGGSLAVYRHGVPVVDIWDGWTERTGSDRWQADTMALCFSTTKGVVTTLLHRVMELHDLEYDERVADLWPAFGQAGKAEIRVRELLGHAAGLHRIRGLVGDPQELLDHRHMAALLAAQPSDPRRVGTAGYHALTYGWLIAGLIEAITGQDVRDTLRRELAEPLALDGLWFGAPTSDQHRVANLFPKLDFTDSTVDRLDRTLGVIPPARGLLDASMVKGFAPLVFANDGRIHTTAMPSVNGVFTARSLAKLYSALSGDGAHGDVRLFSASRLQAMGRIQYRNRDFVLGLPMRWRLGYHQAFTGLRHRPRLAFGHFGAGGSGGWADQETGVALGFVTNRMGSTTTPVGDARLLRLGGAVLKAARAA